MVLNEHSKDDAYQLSPAAGAMPMSRHPEHHPLRRRDVLRAGLGGAALIGLNGCLPPLFDDRGRSAAVAILRAGYDTGLLAAIEAGFDLVPPPDVAGKRVLLKPNLVDLPRENKPICTHPEVIVAAAEAFRRRGAAEVLVADGPALQRDAWQIVDALGLTQRLTEHGLPFIDLNSDALVRVNNAGTAIGLPALYYSRTALLADVLVSIPKMKTHHWLGVSLGMKNLFGLVSSLAYGWPRNIFHLRDPNTAVLDFNRTRPADYCMIDGITGLEGDGPVRGTPIHPGVIVMSDSLTAADATAARVMGIAPERVTHLRMAAGALGPIGEGSIEQRGESIAATRMPFQAPPNQAGLVV